jgi:hypothetical protein
MTLKRMTMNVRSRIDGVVQLTEEEWFDKFKPLPNHLDENAQFTDGDQGYLFETYGKELDFVKAQEPNRIWTHCEDDSGNTYIYQGMRIVDRIGYFVTAVPFDGSKDYQIQINDEDLYECENCGEVWEDEVAALHYDKFEDLQKCAGCATIEELKELEEMENHTLG